MMRKPKIRPLLPHVDSGFCSKSSLYRLQEF
jgi:hypothetical protein